MITAIKHVCSERNTCFVSPKRDFTRSSKISPQDIFKCLLTMESSSLSHELLNYFDYSTNIPTKSAFVQARAKIRSEAFGSLFDKFNALSSEIKLFKGFSLLACDGSDIHIPTNKSDADSFISGKTGSKPYNMLHLNALYDLLSHIYTDVIIQKKHCSNEHSALLSMAQRHFIDLEQIIVIADRGYESYNTFAHFNEAGQNFLIRIRDSKNCIMSVLDLPEGEFDKLITFKLVRKQTNAIKKQLLSDPYLKFISSSCTFDFVPSKNKKSEPTVIYELPVRIVRFKISDDSYEVIATNLSEDLFSSDDLKMLYSMRWGIETSFRDLKYTVGLRYFHAKKTESILQEIYARLIMYNFSELAVSNTAVQPNDRKWSYRINFSHAVHVCRNFLLKRVPLSSVEVLIAADILPIRTGKNNPRALSQKH
ncbi:IS4 family transposase, partial [Ruminococcus sp.]